MIRIRVINDSNSLSLKVDGEDYPLTVEQDQIIINKDHVQNIEIEVNGTLTINDIDYDGIRFGIVTFLCVTANGRKETQITDGILKIEFEHPIWQFWCERYNKFNYEDYPLGSIG